MPLSSPSETPLPDHVAELVDQFLNRFNTISLTFMRAIIHDIVAISKSKLGLRPRYFEAPRLLHIKRKLFNEWSKEDFELFFEEISDANNFFKKEIERNMLLFNQESVNQ